MPNQGLLLPIVSGLLLVGSFPPFHLLLPPFVALVPFVLYLRGLPDGVAGSREGFRAGGALGVVYFGLLLVWLLPALSWLTSVGPFLYVVVVLLLAAFPAAVGWSVHRLGRRGGVPTVLALPVAWTAGEWLRGSLPGGLAFPWLGLGTSLTAHPELVGFAELVGSRGVTFWIVLINALIAEVLLGFLPAGRLSGIPSGTETSGTSGEVRPRWARRTPSAGWTLGVLAVVVAVPTGWSVWRARTLPTSRVARLTLVRTDVSAATKAEPGSALETTRAQLRRLGFGDGRRTLERPGLVVWPETVFPFPLPDAAGAGRRGDEGLARRSPDSSYPGEAALAFAREVSSEEGAPFLLGALDSTRSNAGDGPAVFNAAYLVESGRGAAEVDEVVPEGEPMAVREPLASVVYRKRFLVPLVEASPRFLPSLSISGRSREGGARSGAVESLSPGRWPGPVPVPGIGRGEATGGADGNPGREGGSSPRMGILICFESAFPGASRRYRAEGADFLVNLTNDVWFGEGGGPVGAAGGRQHEAHVVMRAVENRMGVARSANGGGTFFVDPVGRIQGRAIGGSPGVVVGEVTTSPVRTLYSRTGDLVGPGSAAVVVLLLLALGWRDRTANRWRRSRTG